MHCWLNTCKVRDCSTDILQQLYVDIAVVTTRLSWLSSFDFICMIFYSVQEIPQSQSIKNQFNADSAGTRNHLKVSIQKFTDTWKKVLFVLLQELTAKQHICTLIISAILLVSPVYFNITYNGVCFHSAVKEQFIL